MKKLILTILLTSAIFAQNTHDATGWSYSQSTGQAFYMFESILIDGVEAEGDGEIDPALIAADDDVVAAFREGVCVGFIEYKPFAIGGYTTVPAMGAVGGLYPGMMNSGDVPDFLIYDASNGSILELVPADVIPGWADFGMNNILGGASASNTFGCTDAAACNYDASATADDGSCADDDCAGECGGSAEVDECGECGGSGIAAGECDCAGNVNDCAGVCGGSSSEDVCGVCDGDDSSCDGCMTECADNYDADALVDDGSCTYTVNPVDDLSASSGVARVTLTWSTPDLMCDASYSYDVYDSDGTYVKSTSSNSTTVTGLPAGIEACFTVVATNEYGVSANSDEACATPSADTGGIAWGLDITAEIDGWGTFYESDVNNALGVAPSATYGYDSDYDVPEPQAGVGQYISLYFPHTEWDESWAGDNFTQDVVTENDEFFEDNLTTWDIVVISSMSGEASVTFDFINTPLSVPMYAELNGSSSSISDGSSLSFFLSQGIPQGITVTIGNRVPDAPANLSADGGDRSIALAWDASGGLYPADDYTVYREDAADVDQTGTSYTDNEDRDGHNGQGLLYESTWAYTVTASNAAGESTDGYSTRASGGAQVDYAGTQSDASATTDDNLDPVAAVGHVASENGTNLSDGAYEIPHNGSPDANEITIHIDGSDSDDADEFDSITTFSWTQTDGGIESLSLSNADSDDVSFNVSNIHDGDTKNFSFNLHVTSDYPIRGGSATRTSDASISVSIDDEPNEDPVASGGLDLIVPGDGNSDVTMDDNAVSDGNDYDGDDQEWYVPHDGDPVSSTASLSFDASLSSDADADVLSYSWTLIAGEDLNFSFTDLNENGDYDLGEPVFDYGGGEIYVGGIVGSTEITYDDDLPADVYIVEMTVTDTYGDSNTSVVVIGVEGERNQTPTATAGDDQEWYMPYEQDEFDITVDDNHGEDDDNDYLAYSWSAEGFDSNGYSDGWLALVQSLAEGSHTFTFSATDNYGASASDDVTIIINPEPGAAVVASFVISHTDLKYAIIDWIEGTLADDFGGAYTGTLNNTKSYDLYRNGDLIATYEDEDEVESSYTHVDESLSASTAYTYEVVSWNSDGLASDPASTATTTHDRPTVSVLNPNGGEINSVGDAYSVDFSTTNPHYISLVDVYYAQDGSTYELASSSSDGNTVSFSISDDTGTEVNYDANVKVIVTDVGDYNAANKESNEDASDNSFTMAAHTLSHSFNSGWSMFGSALDVSDGNNGGLMDDNLEAPLGSWGADWLVYDSDGAYEDLSLTLGEGFYLALASDDVLVLEGDPVTGDPDNAGDFAAGQLSLSDGWNLIANPLVIPVDKADLSVSYNGDSRDWDDAVNAGWVAPTVNGWLNDSHFPYEQLQPWGGYWINASRDVTISFRPNGSGLSRVAEENNVWTMTVKASDVENVASGDYITVGLSENADARFRFGEDEYDLPNATTSSLIDMHIDNQNWMGTTDINGNSVNTPYFFKDIRSIDYDDYQAWNFSGEKYSMGSNIVLSWDAPVIDTDVHMIVGDNVIDMKSETSFEVASLENATIVVGSVDSFLNPVPEQFSLSAAYPNPFNPSTNLKLDLNKDGFVSVKVYNVVGQVVAELVNGYMEAGFHSMTWNASNMASGMYLVRVEAGTNIAIQKIMLLK